ncbi:hypothetical protein Tco_0538095 [Tanacetum coccineum]
MVIPMNIIKVITLIKEAKKVVEAVEKRFGRKATTRKTPKCNLLKQQYENFNAHEQETIDQTFDRLQNLVSQLELLDESFHKKMLINVNQKLLRSLSPEWNTHAVVWRNKRNINGAVNTAHGVSTASIQVNDAYSINIDNLSDAVICAFFEGSLIINGNETISFDIFQKWIATTGTKGTSLLGSARALRNHGSADEWSNYALMAFSSSSPDSEMKLLLNELVVENCKAMSIEEEPKVRIIRVGGGGG